MIAAFESWFWRPIVFFRPLVGLRRSSRVKGRAVGSVIYAYITSWRAYGLTALPFYSACFAGCVQHPALQASQTRSLYRCRRRHHGTGIFSIQAYFGCVFLVSSRTIPTATKSRPRGSMSMGLEGEYWADNLREHGIVVGISSGRPG